MTEPLAPFGAAPSVKERWSCSSCKVRLWEEALYCPLCGEARDGSVADRPDPREIEIATLRSEREELRRELQQERDLNQTKVDKLTSALLAKDQELEKLRSLIQRLEIEAADRSRDVERLNDQIARLKRFGVHWLWPIVLGVLAGIAIGVASAGLLDRDPGPPLAEITLDERWVPLFLPHERNFVLSSDRPFRVRGPDGLFVVEPGEAVALPPGGPLEARAVEGKATLSVTAGQ